MKSPTLVFIFFLLTAKLFAQDTTRHDPYLRGTIILVDSIGIPHDFAQDGVKMMYKFKIDELTRGAYNFPYIYVGATNDLMHQFNWLLNTGVRYYWCLADTKKWHDGIPIYRHSCSW